VNTWLAFGGIVVGLVGAGGIASIITKHMEIRAKEREVAASGGKENQFIDQLQEQNDRLQTRVDHLESNQRALVAYVFELYAHISEKKDPPPPPMPKLL
jgi:predicted transcriptional regulator